MSKHPKENRSILSLFEKGSKSKFFYLLISLVLLLLFYLFTLITIISYVFRDEEVTGDTIYGAICVYFLIGITWTTIFVLINILQPGSFYINPPNNIDNVQDWSDLIYYSYATLTTLGYGDITPVTSQARSVGVLEPIVGHLYLTILLVRLIGLHLTKSIKRESQYMLAVSCLGNFPY